MSTSAQPMALAPLKRKIAYRLRILSVIATTEFKLKYADSALGYVWSLIKPLSLFSVLLLVFGHILKLGNFPHYGVYLLVGLVLWFFFVDSCNATMASIVSRGSLLRRLSFPYITIPISASLTAGITFCVNTLAVATFIAVEQFTPRYQWLAILPLLIELYAFTLGLGLILASLYVRFRDVGQIWELVSQVLFYATPIIYLPEFLPRWFQPITFMNPFAQVMQDIRSLLIPFASDKTVTHYLGGSSGRLIPIGVTGLVLTTGLLLFRREAPYFAERV